MIEPILNTSKEIHRGLIYWISPIGNVVEVSKFKIDTSKNQKIIDFPGNSLNNGLWTVVYVDFAKKVTIVHFLMTGNEEIIEEIEVNLSKYEIDALKSIKSETGSVENWLKSTFVQKENCFVDESCKFSFWSSRYPDQFSKIEL